jgi:hypothetical protein
VLLLLPPPLILLLLPLLVLVLVLVLMLLMMVLVVLVKDRGRSCRLIRTAGCLRSFSSPHAPPRDEVTESGDKLREHLKAAINLKAVGEYSGVWFHWCLG